MQQCEFLRDMISTQYFRDFLAEACERRNGVRSHQDVKNTHLQGIYSITAGYLHKNHAIYLQPTASNNVPRINDIVSLQNLNVT